MSEIKGQMLGMVLVLMVFGLVAGILYASFKQSAEKISSQLANENGLVSTASAKSAYRPLVYQG
jgi:anionic cell wall polymer biosynthesis LytR-Cps2A-Psr (LCP) family protein